MYYVMWNPWKRACGITIMPETRSNMYFWLLGDSFLRAYFTVYNVDQSRIGLLNVNTSKRPEKSRRLEDNKIANLEVPSGMKANAGPVGDDQTSKTADILKRRQKGYSRINDLFSEVSDNNIPDTWEAILNKQSLMAGMIISVGIVVIMIIILCARKCCCRSQQE